MYYALIMAGGSGTRLWPLSRQSRPKQTLRLVGERSMFQHAVDRLEPLFSYQRILVGTRHEYAGLLQQQVPELPAANLILEPEGHGTAPAIGLAAIHIHLRDPEAVMAVLTADHTIRATARFRQTLSAAEAVAQKGALVTLGILPATPSTGYGYIKQAQICRPTSGARYAGYPGFRLPTTGRYDRRQRPGDCRHGGCTAGVSQRTGAGGARDGKTVKRLSLLQMAMIPKI